MSHKVCNETRLCPTHACPHEQAKQAEVLLSLAGRVAARLGMALEDIQALMAPSQVTTSTQK